MGERKTKQLIFAHMNIYIYCIYFVIYDSSIALGRIVRLLTHLESFHSTVNVVKQPLVNITLLLG